MNISVALQYLNQWLDGNGAAAINNLMEDAATAEISRAQLWQWLRHEVELADGRNMSRSLYEEISQSELVSLKSSSSENHFDSAAEILDGLVLNDEFEDFLTLPAYKYLD